MTEKTPSGDRTADLVKESDCWVVCALLCPVCVGTCACFFAEFDFPKTVGVFSCTVTKTMQPLSPASSLCHPLDFFLFFLLPASSSLSVSSLHLSFRRWRYEETFLERFKWSAPGLQLCPFSGNTICREFHQNVTSQSHDSWVAVAGAFQSSCS